MSLLRTAACCLLLTSLAGCNRTVPTETIWIGHVAPLSGPNKSAGERARQGIELAVEDANRDESLGGGKRVAVLHVDTHGDLDTLQPEVVRLISVNHVVALLGGLEPAQVERLGRASQPYSAPVLTPSVLPPAPLASQVYSLSFSPTFQGQMLARYAAEELKQTRLTVLVDGRGAFATALAEALVREFSAKEKSRADQWTYRSDTELLDLAERVTKGETAAVVLAGSAADLAKLRPKLPQGDTHPLLFAGEPVNVGQLAAQRDAANGVYAATVFAADKGLAAAEQFAQTYQKKFGEPPDVHAAFAYDGVRLLVEGIRRAKATPNARLVEELPKIDNFEGLCGKLALDKEDHYARRTLFVVRLVDGRFDVQKRYESNKPVASEAGTQ